MITTETLAPFAVSAATSGAIFAAMSPGLFPAADDHASIASKAPMNRSAKLTAMRGSKNPRDESPFMKPGIMRRQVQINSARKFPQPPCRSTFHIFANEIRHRFLPRTRLLARERLILRARKHAVSRPFRDETLHLRERRRADRARLHRHAFRAAAIERALRVLLPAALAAVREMQNAAYLFLVREQRLQQFREVERVGRRRPLVGDRAHLLALARLINRPIHKARPVRPEHPRHPDDERALVRFQHAPLAFPLRFAVDTDRFGLVFLRVGLALFPIENILGADVNESRLSARANFRE